MLPNMMPFSVEATLTCARMEAKSLGASTTGAGRSTSRSSPSVASSTQQFCSVSSAHNTPLHSQSQHICVLVVRVTHRSG